MNTLTFSSFEDYYTSTPNLEDSAPWPQVFEEAIIPDPGTEKEEQLAWSPALYPEGCTRRLARNVSSITALVLDLDAGYTSIEDILQKWGHYELVIYTSWSHDPSQGKHKYRVVLPLKSPVDVPTHAALWAWAKGVDPNIDAACKDPCRIYGWPVDRGQKEYHYNQGKLLDLANLNLNVQVKTPSILQDILQKAHVPSPPTENYDTIRSRCTWVEHAHQDAPTLGEPEWYAWLSILSRCKGGEDIAHTIGSSHPGYSEEETREKFSRATTLGPRTCTNIEGLNDEHCRTCAHRGTITSPVQLGKTAHTQPTPPAPVDILAPTPVLPTPVEAPVEVESSPVVPETELSRAITWRDNVQAQIDALDQAHTELETNLKKLKAKLKHVHRFGVPGEGQDVPILTEIAETEGAIRECKRQRGEHHNNLQRANRAVTLATKAEDVPPLADAVTWAALRKKEGEVLATPLNLDTILRNDPQYKGKFWLDVFAVQPYFGKAPMNDTLDQRIITDLERRYGVVFRNEVVRGVIPVVSEDKSVHPVKEYLETLQWDGVPRCHRLIHDGFKAINITDDKLVEKMSTNFLLALVARIFSPGCKAENMLVLSGRQRKFKSSALRALVSPPNPYGQSWFTDSAFDMDSKDGVMIIQGQWLIELGELDKFKGHRATKIKAFLSCQEDKIRLPYGRHTVKLPRSCLLAGTTNEDTFLLDSTGNLRFYTVEIAKCDIDWIVVNREQLWAEAVVRYNAGEKWWFEEEEEQDRLTAQNRRFEVVHPWSELVEQFVRRTRSNRISVTEVLVKVLEIPAAQLSPEHSTRVVGILRGLGFESPGNVRETVNNTRDYFWTVPESFFRVGVDDKKVVSILSGQGAKK